MKACKQVCFIPLKTGLKQNGKHWLLVEEKVYPPAAQKCLSWQMSKEGGA